MTVDYFKNEIIEYIKRTYHLDSFWAWLKQVSKTVENANENELVVNYLSTIDIFNLQELNKIADLFITYLIYTKWGIEGFDENGELVVFNIVRNNYLHIKYDRLRFAGSSNFLPTVCTLVISLQFVENTYKKIMESNTHYLFEVNDTHSSFNSTQLIIQAKALQESALNELSRVNYESLKNFMILELEKNIKVVEENYEPSITMDRLDLANIIKLFQNINLGYFLSQGYSKENLLNDLRTCRNLLINESFQRYQNV